MGRQGNHNQVSRLLPAAGLLLALALLAAVLVSGCGKTASKTETPATPSAKTTTTAPAATSTPAAPAGGKVYNVVISSKPGQWNLDQREKGYRDTLAKDYPQIHVLQTIDDETKYTVGQEKASAVLAAHPDLAGFAGVNAASGPGIAAAVEAAGLAGKIPIVAMDADSATLDKIQQGVITASVAQRQYYMSYIGVKYLYGIVHGYFRAPGDTKHPNLPEIPTTIDTGTVEVNKSNIAAFRTPSQGAKEELPLAHPDWVSLLSNRKKGEARPGEEYVMIGISTGVEYWNANREGLKDVCKELGVKGTFDGPPDQNPEAQANILDRVIARRPAGILIAPGDPNTLLPYINKAIGDGIPVICVDTDAPKSKRLAYYGTSNYAAGCMGAKILAKAILGKNAKSTAAGTSAGAKAGAASAGAKAGAKAAAGAKAGMSG